MRAIIIALVIVGGLLCASLENNLVLRENSAIRGEHTAYLENQSILDKEQALLDKEQILQLQDEIRLCEEAQHQQVAFGGNRLLEFGSVEELELWLTNDPISDREWVEEIYDCDDFAVDLTLAALADGYWIGLGIAPLHMFNFTIICNTIYRIEASSDEVTHWALVD